MTNEQREAIDNLSEIVKLSKEELQKENENITAILDYKDLKSLGIVLSLIKEQQEEIEKLKVNLAKSCADRTLDRETLKNQENENLEALHRAYNEELQKKDMQIDLMAESIELQQYANIDTSNLDLVCEKLKCNKKCELVEKDCIKQYFAELVEDVDIKKSRYIK